LSLQDLGALFAGSAAIALVCSADMSLLSRIFAMRGGYHVNNNQELIALGAANVFSGLFQGFAVSGSASRTPIAESAGAKTQLTGIVGAVTIALLLTFSPSLLSNLPNAALAAVVVTACLSLFELGGVVKLFHVRRSEFAISILCFLGVIIVGVIPGIFISVAVALLAFIWRAWRPYSAVLGRVDGLKGYHDVSRHHEARRIPGLVLFRWDAPLFFANAGVFRERVLEAVAQSPTPVRWVVVAAEPVTDVDTTAADELQELDRDLHGAGIELCFAELKGPAKDRLIRYGLFKELGQDNFYRTLGQAVDSYLSTHNVEWHDWKE
jgi:MFS superfamily sulfate permease-like transporter